jgi:hypothetical protein
MKRHLNSLAMKKGNFQGRIRNYPIYKSKRIQSRIKNSEANGAQIKKQFRIHNTVSRATFFDILLAYNTDIIRSFVKKTN